MVFQEGDTVHKAKASFATGKIGIIKGGGWYGVEWTYTNIFGTVCVYYREERGGDLILIKPRERETGMDDNNPNRTFTQGGTV